MQFKMEKQFLVALFHFKRGKRPKSSNKMPKIAGPEKLKSDLELRKDVQTKF